MASLKTTKQNISLDNIVLEACEIMDENPNKNIETIIYDLSKKYSLTQDEIEKIIHDLEEIETEKDLD
ncbi:MAG: hypothetical protein ACP5OG_05970 [Candidatus Nanoarchaeia archaeon]